MEMVNLHLLQPFVIALFLGALLGFERTFASRLDHEVEDFLGGIRTYSLVSLFGALATFLSDRYFPEVLALSFAGIIAMTAVSYYIGFNKHNEGGITTEVSLLICFLIGVTVQKQHVTIALFITLGTAGLLHMKDYLHRITDKVETKDIRATLKFAIITFIILMFDPDYTFYFKDIGAIGNGLFDRFPGLSEVQVVNPYNVWLMVVLISAIGFTGYMAIKILGPRKGTGLTGLFGGLVSSTATTVTFSKRSREGGRSDLPYAVAVLLACSTMFPRVLVEALVINAKLVPLLIISMGFMTVAGFAVCLVLWKKSGKEKSDEVPHQNPFNILPAVKFGLIFAAIVCIARLTEVIAGDSGVYIISVLTGLSDVDPITLTMSQISRDDPSKLNQAAVAITLAAFSNTIMKAGMALLLGSRRFATIVLIGFGITLLAGALGLILMVMI
jgi:uncharacterized membrane protein (DUF4010 family)